MTINYLDSKRISGTTADRNGTPAVSGGWKELGRTTLGSTGDTIDVSSLADKRYYMVLTNPIMNGSTPQTSFRMGNGSADAGASYSWREERDGATDVTGVNANWQTLVGYTAGNAMDFAVLNIANVSGKEKLTTSKSVYGVTGAANAPHRTLNVGKWANTSNPIDVLQTYNSYLSEYAIGSEMVVLGWDPADTHTTNFWEELASVSGDGTSTTLSSGTITAKKYLWVQAYSNATSQDSAFQFNNDTAGNYSTRWSDNGGADSTSTSESRIDLTFGSPSFTNMFIINNSANEKLCIHDQLDASTAGAGTAPRRYERVSKWANTSAQITEIDYINQSTSVNFPSGSIMKVWGSD